MYHYNVVVGFDDRGFLFDISRDGEGWIVVSGLEGSRVNLAYLSATSVLGGDGSVVSTDFRGGVVSLLPSGPLKNKVPKNVLEGLVH